MTNKCTHCPVHCQSIFEVLNERYRRYGRRLKRIYVSIKELKQANDHAKETMQKFKLLSMESVEEEDKLEQQLLNKEHYLMFKGVKLVIR